MVHHLSSNNLLYNHQYGFLPKRSTEHNLLQIVNYITTALNEGMFCIGVFLELRKAFDVCSHLILLAKLNGAFSDLLNLDISVIQGSILGPILFLCYLNDFWLATSRCSRFYLRTTPLGLVKVKILMN
jgi:hypothetical protein